MKSIAKLKDKARKHEQKEDWQAAIAVYQQVLDTQEEEEDLELELTLFNRIGDLNLRLGQTDEAVDYYETAADKYAESGFYNNAIALCNKALRHRPDRASIYLKLSRLCTEQGFQTDARRWILEYAERKGAAGEEEAALTALEDFAEMSDDPEVRELLAQQFASHDRPQEAIGQLRSAYAMRVQAGEMEEAASVAEKAQAIDPSVDLASEEVAPAPEVEPDEFETAGLDYQTDEADVAGGPADLEAGEPAGEPAGVSAETGGEEVGEIDAGEVEAGGMEGLETHRVDADAEAEEAGLLEGLESTAAGPEPAETDADHVAGLEVGFSEQETVEPESEGGDTLGGLETFSPAPGDEAEDAPDVEPDEEPAAAELDVGELDEVEDEEDEGEPLPMLDTGLEELEDQEEEEGEPLPMLDTGFEEMEEEPDTDMAAEGPLDLDAGGGLDMDASAGADAEGGAGDGAEDQAGDEAGAMDLDLGSFDLGFEGAVEPEEKVSAESLDIEAILGRARELVSRGLTGEALREIRVLSGSDAGPDVFRDAMGIVNEIIRHDENDVSALQRRVEYAARIGDRELLVDAYLDLGDGLSRLGAETKARAMYERARDLDPSHAGVQEALGQPQEEDDEVVDLDAILREMEPEEMEAAGRGGGSGDSDPNFAAMLNQFKAKVTENVDAEEAGDHYDLGLAFKEMGLIDEAIAEFQTALTGGEERLKVYEELGQCFVQKGQYNVALKVFNRALKVPHADDSDLLGVYYHLGQCYEELGQRQDAREAYEKILSIDEEFADVPDRMARL